jgi:phosphoglycerol transferase MdoB-like AlkP superfamily enzyme
MELILGVIVTMAIPAYFVVQPMLLLRWGGGWRRAALVPLLLIVPALAFSLFALTQDSNLWPITLIFAAAIGMLYLAGLWSFKQWLGRDLK